VTGAVFRLHKRFFLLPVNRPWRTPVKGILEAVMIWNTSKGRRWTIALGAAAAAIGLTAATPA